MAEITDGARGVDGAVEAAAELQRGADQPVSRDLGTDARGTDPKNTIITHDAGSPRDQISPFWVSTEPLSYIGWGKTTQLGMGLGLAMGAKLAKPDKLCINFWGDAAIGFTGMDFETAVRERIPILSMPDEQLLHGDRAEGDAGLDREVPLHRHLRQLRRHGEGVRRLWRARDRSRRRSRRRSSAASSRRKAGKPALLEFITAKETRVSKF